MPPLPRVSLQCVEEASADVIRAEEVVNEAKQAAEEASLRAINAKGPREAQAAYQRAAAAAERTALWHTATAKESLATQQAAEAGRLPNAALRFESWGRSGSECSFAF